MSDIEIIVSDLHDISEILNNNGYGGWSNSIQRAIDLLKWQNEMLDRANVIIGQQVDYKAIADILKEVNHNG